MPLAPVSMFVSCVVAPPATLRAIDVRDALAIGQEVQRPAVGRPLRADVLASSNPPSFADVAGRDVHDREPQVPGLDGLADSS